MRITYPSPAAKSFGRSRARTGGFITEFHTGIAHALFTIERLKTAVHDGRRTSVHHQVMNHLGLAERSLGVVHQMVSTLGTVPLDRFYFPRKGGPPDDGNSPRAA